MCVHIGTSLIAVFGRCAAAHAISCIPKSCAGLRSIGAFERPKNCAWRPIFHDGLLSASRFVLTSSRGVIIQRLELSPRHTMIQPWMPQTCYCRWLDSFPRTIHVCAQQSNASSNTSLTSRGSSIATTPVTEWLEVREPLRSVRSGS